MSVFVREVNIANIKFSGWKKYVFRRYTGSAKFLSHSGKLQDSGKLQGFQDYKT